MRSLAAYRTLVPLKEPFVRRVELGDDMALSLGILEPVCVAVCAPNIGVLQRASKDA